jgi:hypothetical protein
MIDFGRIEDWLYGGKNYRNPCPFCGHSMQDDETEVRYHMAEGAAYDHGAAVERNRFALDARERAISCMCAILAGGSLPRVVIEVLQGLRDYFDSQRDAAQPAPGRKGRHD